jgi:hypothetical protein
MFRKLLAATASVTMMVLFVALTSMAQEPMTNDGVIKLVKSGMSEDLIISIVQRQAASYTLGADDLVTLKSSGVSEKIIAAMLARSKGEPAAASSDAGARSGAAAPGSGRTTVPSNGLFYKKGSEYFELLTENVEWSTGGAMKNIASAGIVKKDLKGSLPGSSSRNFLTNPMEIVISPGGGTTVNSYILLPLRPDNGERQFTVGPVNKKSGVAKGAIPFGVEKVGENQFRMVLQTPLGPGEYGILEAIPVGDAATVKTKMFTFRILL